MKKRETDKHIDKYSVIHNEKSPFHYDFVLLVINAIRQKNRQ